MSKNIDRIAEALEGIELALMVLAGLWAPEGEGAEAGEWDCVCGTRLRESLDVFETACPGCGQKYLGDGSGKWIQTE
jgi:hypothetical protein